MRQSVEIADLADCITILAKARDQYAGKPLAKNVRLIRRGNDCVIRYYQTDVVTYHPDGTLTLRHGGWDTISTRDVINAFSPVYVEGTKGAWTVTVNGNRHPFIDGMIVRVETKGPFQQGNSDPGQAG